MSNKDLENSLSEALCCVDKIETLTRLLQQTIIEKTDFKEKDSLNICSILTYYHKNLKMLLKDIEFLPQRKNIVD